MRVELLVFFIAVVVIVSAHSNRRRGRKDYGSYDRYNIQSYGSGRVNNILYDRGINHNYLYGGGIFKDLSVRPGQCGRQLNRRSCPLFDFRSNVVSKDDFISKVMDQANGWFTLLSIEINSAYKYGKCIVKCNLPHDGDTFVRNAVCYNEDLIMCDSFNAILTLGEDECGQVRITGVNDTSVETIYSQDLDTYFWRDVCYTQVGDVCEDGRYIDMTVKGDRFVNTADRVADITGIPWDKVAADLRQVFDRDIREVRHTFLGEECDFPY